LEKLQTFVSKENDPFNGNAVIETEEKIKKCDRIIYQLIQICDKVTSRHEHAIEQEKMEKYMKYKLLQNVFYLIIFSWIIDYHAFIYIIKRI
jgi:hypothetical protein